MKKLLFILIVLFGFIINSNSQTILIDHNCTDISQIPSSEINSVQDNIKWHYAHTSHGEQIVCGLDELETSQSEYAVEIGYSNLPNVPDELCVFDGQEGFTYINPQHYWSSAYGLQYTHDVLNHNPSINVSGFMWCIELEEYSAAQVDHYFSAMALLEADYPDVTFVYFTGNAQADGASGYNRYLRNEQIRDYCAANDKVLYDFADIDCWYNGEMNSYEHQGETVPIEHTAYYGNYWTQCGHANEISRSTKAQAAWWLMARLNGWSGNNSLELDVKIFLEGVFNGINMNATLNSQGLLPISQPFDVHPWNYFGDESVVSNMPTSIVVDWVLVELRDTTFASLATSETIIGVQAALLLNNGNVVGMDGTNALQFTSITITNNLFVVIYHRNHLGILSADPLVLDNGVYSVDFTTDGATTYGSPSGIKEINTGIWGMAGGNFDGNGIVDINDKTIGWDLQAGNDGYFNGDFNLDGSVNNVDKNGIWETNLDAESEIPD